MNRSRIVKYDEQTFDLARCAKVEEVGAAPDVEEAGGAQMWRRKTTGAAA